MTDDPPDDHLSIDPFWGVDDDDERQREIFAKILSGKESWISGTYSDETWKEHNIDIWEKCKRAGTRVCDLEPYIDKSQGHLGRLLKAGTANERDLWIAVQVSGLDPQVVMTAPNSLQQFRGKTRTVEMFRHQCRTVNLPISAADRIPIDKLSGAHGALLQSLLADGHVVQKWLQMAVPIANDFKKAACLPAMVTFVDTIYTQAAQFVAGNQESLSLLQAWSPRRAGLPTALGRIAQAWNRYQMHWFLATEVIDAI